MSLVRFRPEAPSYADLAHLVERHLAKVEVASSSLVIRSKRALKVLSALYSTKSVLLHKIKYTAPWPSGKAGACKALIPSSILGGASKKKDTMKIVSFFLFCLLQVEEKGLIIAIIRAFLCDIGKSSNLYKRQRTEYVKGVLNMKNINKMKMKDFISYLTVILAAILLAFNYQLFIVMNGFAPAGLNGIATMIQFKTGFSIGYMSLVINVPLCIVAYFLINKAFALRSLVFSITYSFVYLFLQELGLSQFQYNANGHDTIYPVLLSGAISGAVYGMCFVVNASTGGTDIVSKYISIKRPNLNFFWVTFGLNIIVAATSFLFMHRLISQGI